MRPFDDLVASAPSLPPHVFVIGDVLGATYEIRKVLGEGGMGQVFEAHDRHLNRKVAIKVVLEDVDPVSLRREGQALAAIRHPSVVTVYAFGTEGTIPYLVLEHVAGLSLDAYIEQRRRRGESFTIAEVVDILCRVAEGLMIIHRAGISHRDIKPGNLMLAPGNRLVLMDFGLVLPEIDVRKYKAISGSLGYMAPEVIAGSVQPGTGHLADLYALGVVGYELLTGALPFDSDNLVAHLSSQVIGPVPDASAHRAGIPQALGTLLRELLAPEPRERAQSAETVLWQLRAIQDRVAGTVREGERFSVLIVDDDVEIWEPLSLVVRGVIPDAEIETVTNGKDALRAVRRRVPRLLLLDIDLPDINGIELAMYIRGTRLGDRCAIISVSGRATEPDVQLLSQLDVRFVGKTARLREELAVEIQKLHPQR